MKILKKILMVLAIIVAIPLLAALFINKNYTVTRDVTINQPSPLVFSYIRMQRNQDHYNKWVMKDPAMQKQYRGEDGNTGFVYSWNSKEMGAGEQEITGIREGSEVQSTIHFIKPFESVAHTSMTTDAVSGNQTRVQWRMDGRSAYPMNLMNLFLDGILGKDMESSLLLMKKNLEAQ